MDKVTVKKDELLVVLKDNKEKHKNDYADAMKAYRVKATDLLAKRIEDLDTEYNKQVAKMTKDFKEQLKKLKKDSNKNIDYYKQQLQHAIAGEDFSPYGVSKPVCYVKEYDLALRMFEMSIDELATLDRDEFSQLVNDDWHWKSTFRSTNQNYLGYYGVTSLNYNVSGSSYAVLSNVAGMSGVSGASGTSGSPGTLTADITFPDIDYYQDSM